MGQPQSLGKRIAQARRELGVREHRDVTQLDLAKAVGVSGAAVSDWEADKKVPREGALTSLAAYLQVTPAYLRYGVVEPPALADLLAGSRKLTEAELDRAEAIVARDEARKPRAKKRARKRGESA